MTSNNQAGGQGRTTPQQIGTAHIWLGRFGKVEISLIFLGESKKKSENMQSLFANNRKRLNVMIAGTCWNTGIPFLLIHFSRVSSTIQRPSLWSQLWIGRENLQETNGNHGFLPLKYVGFPMVSCKFSLKPIQKKLRIATPSVSSGTTWPSATVPCGCTAMASTATSTAASSRRPSTGRPTTGAAGWR